MWTGVPNDAYSDERKITVIKRKISEIKESDPLTERIIGCAFEVHSELGPGFHERIYENALKIALKEKGVQ